MSILVRYANFCAKKLCKNNAKIARFHWSRKSRDSCPTSSVPTQRILFLGMLIDSTTMEFILPTEKSENIQRECRNLLKTQQLSIRQISRVLGLLEFTRPAIWAAPLHYRHIQLLQIESLRRTCDFDTQVNLSKEAN